MIAEAIHEKLEGKVYAHDLVFFCAQTIGGLALSTHTDLMPIAIALGKYTNNLHYYHALELYGPPNREEPPNETSAGDRESADGSAPGGS